MELNFDGIVGPTHHYAGLAAGNLASQAHGGQVSYPRQAALQGLAKMRRLAELGVPQAVLPPHERPNLPMLRQVGFSGDDAAVLRAALDQSPTLLAAACSASSMWAANAATVCPSCDSGDGRVHLTPANLVSNLHRRLEPPFTAAVLARVLGGDRFAHHQPLPATPLLGDEGAANHLRLATAHDSPGVQVFVHGRGESGAPQPSRYPARQTLLASQAVARLHRLDPDRTLFVQQNPAVIDAGVFHNDVIAVAHRQVLLCHQDAWLDQPATLARLRRLLPEFVVIEVPRRVLSVAEAVASYLFNSQIVDLPAGGMAIVCPQECVQRPAVRDLLDQIIADPANPIVAVHPVDVRQSMQNGGGPACLRLRVPLTETEAALMHPAVRWTPELHERLTAWVQRHYRSELRLADLADPLLLRESRDALDDLSRLLALPGLYGFQQ